MAAMAAWKRLKAEVLAGNHAVIVLRCGAGCRVNTANGLVGALEQALAPTSQAAAQVNKQGSGVVGNGALWSVLSGESAAGAKGKQVNQTLMMISFRQSHSWKNGHLARVDTLKLWPQGALVCVVCVRGKSTSICFK